MAEKAKNNDAIASRLRKARELAGLTQGQVAKKLGLHRPSVSEMEAGRRKVSSEELKDLSDLYGVSVSWLIGEEAENESDFDDTVRLAARELSKLKPDDLDKLLKLLKMLRKE